MPTLLTKRQEVRVIKSQTTCYSNGRRPPRKVIILCGLHLRDGARRSSPH